jgi:N-acyl-D-amino-acid deacylase
VKVTVSIPDSISPEADRLGTDRDQRTAIRSDRRATLATVASLVLAICLGSLASSSADDQPFDLLLSGGRVIDGTGNPWFQADIGIRAGRIAAVGRLAGAKANRTLDVTGLVVAPGFIDLHSHADGLDEDGLRSNDPRRRAAPNLVSQGVTTLVVNQDGGSPFSIAEQKRELEEKKFGPNAVLLVGHNTVRAMVMAENRNEPFADSEIARMQRLATPAEIEAMRRLVIEGMEAGAYGMSAGLEYVPGRWSDTEEVVALVKELAPYQGVFVEHERASGADPMWYLPSMGEPGQPTYLDSVEETIEIAERTGVTTVATHAKARGADYWGSSRAAVQLIARARARGVRVYADHYPYNTTGSDGGTRLIPAWVREENETLSWVEALDAVLADPEKKEALRRDVLHEVNRRGGVENVVVMDFPDRSYVGKTLLDLMRELRMDPLELAVHLQTRGRPDERGGGRLRGYSLSEIDVEIYAAENWMATASDAGIALPEDGLVHARYYGTFPRKIRWYAMERGKLSVEDAIRSSTSLPAQILGFRNRGLLREGFHADVVILDLPRLKDAATFFEPHRYAEGIVHVLVGGNAVVENGKLTYALPGRVVTPEEGREPPAASN